MIPALWLGCLLGVDAPDEPGDFDRDGFYASEGDCDDGDPDVNPDAEEICDNGVDDDCDGLAVGCRFAGERELDREPERAGPEEIGVPTFAAVDLDGDGVGQPVVGLPLEGEGGRVYLDAQPWEHSSGNLDDKAEAVLSGGAQQAVGSSLGVGDLDGSGFQDLVVSGSNDHAYEAPPAPPPDTGLDLDVSEHGDADGDGWSPADGDCDDNDEDVHPGADEDLTDDIDQDCDGEAPQDLDGDGFLVEDDCDDADEDVNPDADEVCGNGVDDDCDGTSLGCGFEAYGDVEELAAAEVCRPHPSVGENVAGGGDLDGDGEPDLVLGDSSDGWCGTTGVVWVVSGLSEGSLNLGYDSSAELCAEEDAPLGSEVAVVGDLTGDGLDDLLASASGADLSADNVGAVYLVAGPIGDEESVAQHERVVGLDEGDQVGISLAAGAFDGTGGRQVAIGTYARDLPAENAGAIWLLEPGGWSTVDAAFATIVGGEDDNVGHRLAAFDTDGDGIDDLASGSPWRGDGAARVAVYLGPFEGELAADDHDGELTTGEDDYGTGRRLAAADLDGDGLDDLVVGSPYISYGGLDRGAVFVLSGPVHEASLDDAVATIYGEDDRDELGQGIAVGGDGDGDGVADLLVSAPDHDDEEGAVYAFLGPVEGVLSASQADGHLSSRDEDNLGIGLAWIGDGDGDGLDDAFASVTEYGGGCSSSSNAAGWLVRGAGW